MQPLNQGPRLARGWQPLDAPRPHARDLLDEVGDLLDDLTERSGHGTYVP
jgi:hypothetical protein